MPRTLAQLGWLLQPQAAIATLSLLLRTALDRSIVDKPLAGNRMNPYWLIVAFTLLTQLCVFLRWLHRRLRDASIERAFIRDVALNHLPHIYHALRRIAAHQGVEIDDPPPVHFLELNGAPPKSDPHNA